MRSAGNIRGDTLDGLRVKNKLGREGGVRESAAGADRAPPPIVFGGGRPFPLPRTPGQNQPDTSLVR